MRFNYKEHEPGSNGEIVIRLKEEPAAYYDECTVDKLRNFVQRLRAYYSEKGELVEIRIYTGDLKREYIRERIKTVGPEKEREYQREFEEREKEIMIPDVVPARRYVFLYGKENGEPKGCVDSFKEIWDTDDRFRWMGYLTMWRLDGKEMNENEICKLRNDCLDDVFKFGYIKDYFVESVYMNRKLYFWIAEGHSSPDDLLDCVKEIYEELGYEIEESKERDLGADIIVSKENEKLALICIWDMEYFNRDMGIDDGGRVIEKKELIDVCRNTNEYKTRVIILGSTVQLSVESIEYAKSNNIKIQEILELIRLRNIEIAEFNDEDPEVFEEIYSEIFGED